jgi:L-iditol 2-dehydrogenase
MEQGMKELTAVWSGRSFDLRPIRRWHGSAATVVRPIAAGLCGTDRHLLRHEGLADGKSLGHEILGEVVQVGAGARVLGGSRLQVGDRVVVVPGVACGGCITCLTYGSHEHLCDHRTVHGFSNYREDEYFSVGGFSTEIEVLDSFWMHRVPESVGSERAVLGELVAIAVRAVERGIAGGRPELDVGPGVAARAAVVGMGPVGCCVALVLRSLGMEVVGFEKLDWRRREAQERLGVPVHGVHVESPGSRPETDGAYSDGFDLVVESAGEPHGFELALDLVRKGGRIVEVGHFVPNGLARVDPTVITKKDLEIVGSVLAPPPAYTKAFRLLARTELPFDRIVTHRVPLEQIDSLLPLADANEAFKIVVSPS